MTTLPNLLFLCTGNACRSQMAEGWARHLHENRWQAWSAGLEPKGLDPRAATVMAEVGIDITQQQSKRLAELPTQDYVAVVTVCDHAHESCPILPGAKRSIHRGFPDPPRLVCEGDDEETILNHYRQVRDAIGEFVRGLPEELA